MAAEGLNVFVSYRRTDCQAQANGLHDGLTHRLPSASLFMDVDSMPYGVDFTEHIRSTIDSSDVALVLIGDRWLEVDPETGRRRIDEADDVVRLEVEHALAAPQVRVLPVLVHGASMPRAADLPPNMRRLARLNAIELSDLRWKADLERLARILDELRAHPGGSGSAYTAAGNEPPPASVEIDGFRDAVEFRRGGFGIVYRAYQPEFDRMVALKVVLADAIDDSARERFRAETAAMGRLSGHPHIVPVYGAGFTGIGKPFLVMPFLGRGSAGDLLEARGRLGWEEVVEIGIKIAGALETAHAGGVLHRDLKPDNILFTDYNEPQLGDFGIARLQGAAATASGHLTGSIPYAAPEVLAGQRASAASDVYSLAATLFALLKGGPAFLVDTDETLAPFFARVATQPPPDLADLDVPPAVVEAIHAGMAKVPADRPSGAALFGLALQDAQRRSGSSQTRMVLPPNSDHASSNDTIRAVEAPPLRHPTPQPPPRPIDLTPLPQPRVEQRRRPKRGVVAAVAGVVLAAGAAAILVPRLTAPAAPPRCDYVAAPTGDDTAAGTSDAPFQTINTLLQELQPGQTGCLTAGTFDEIVNIDVAGTATEPILLTPADPAATPPVVRGQLNILRSAEYITIEGFNIVGIQVPTIRLFGKQIHLRHNDISNDSGTCIYMGEPTNGIATDVTIQSNIISSCGADELEPGHNQSGVAIGTANNVRVAGNVIRDMAEWGIVMYPHAENTVIERNVLIGNLQNVHLGGSPDTATGGTQIQRNIFLPSPGGTNVATNWEGEPGGNNVVRENCLGPEDGKSSRVGVSYRDNIRAVPELVAETYLVAAGSECAGMGPTRIPGAAGLSPAAE